LNKKEIATVLETLTGYLHDKSNRVRMFSMQALANLAMDEAKLRPQVIAVLDEVTKTGSPAMKMQGQKLLSDLRKL
jgi:hypothetical protein